MDEIHLKISECIGKEIEKIVWNHWFAEPVTSIITGYRGGIPCNTK